LQQKNTGAYPAPDNWTDLALPEGAYWHTVSSQAGQVLAAVLVAMFKEMGFTPFITRSLIALY